MTTGRPSGALSARQRRLHLIVAGVLLLLTGVLAITSLVTDSITFDETAHLTTAVSQMKTGDFRLAPDHPPLGKLIVMWPALLIENTWVPRDDPAWVAGDVFAVGRAWLFELNDNGQRLVVAARCMMVVLLLATCLAVYVAARSLFGPAAGLLALALASLSPSLLAHGRLTTTDLPITLFMLLTLLAFGHLARRVTWMRTLAAAAAITAAALTKFSWPLMIPALVAMALMYVLGRRRGDTAVAARASQAGDENQRSRRSASGEAPAVTPAPDGDSGRDTSPAEAALASSCVGRLVGVLGAALLIVLIGWLGIWTCYGWRATVVAPPMAGGSAEDRLLCEQANEIVNRKYFAAMHNPDGSARGGMLPGILRFAAVNQLLPDAYLLGLATTLQLSSARHAYLLGEYSDVGWRAYFPIALGIKTPVPMLVLLAAGGVALVLRQAHIRHAPLFVGLLIFFAIYAGYLVNSRLNIGHRHLLPLYPVIIVFASATACWLARRVGRWLIGGAVVWLLLANLWIHPHYISYFNVLVGGPSRGHLYLADSNIDWGQDLLRLADYAERHPDQPIKLAYFGSAIPTAYLDCESLPSYFDFKPRAALTAGTYVVSATQLLGVYDESVRDGFWTNRRRQADGPIDDLRYARLINRLRHRPPDERIGYSLFVYRLSDEEVEQLAQLPTAP